MYLIGLVLFLGLVIWEIFHRKKRIEISKLEDVPGESNYFERLSNVDRKWWIAEELLFRYRYGFQTMTDTTLEALRTTKGKEYKLANDPSNYEILMDSSYLTKLRYASLLEHKLTD
jgi:hypothetical protein